MSAGYALTSLPHDAPVWVRDLARACIHEHAHACAAQHFGVWGRVGIIPTGAGSLEEKHFVGQFHMHGHLRPQHARVVGLAGVMAEAAFFDDFDLDDADALFDDLKYGDTGISESDARLVGRPRLSVVRATASTLRLVWPQLLADASAQFAACMEEADS